jgi:hypothetical protein
MAKKEEPKYLIRVTDSELKGIAFKRVKVWTDWLYPGGLLLGLIDFGILYAFFGSKIRDDIQSTVAIIVSTFVPMLVGFVISARVRNTRVKEKIAELKNASIKAST